MQIPAVLPAPAVACRVMMATRGGGRIAGVVARVRYPKTGVEYTVDRFAGGTVTVPRADLVSIVLL